MQKIQRTKKQEKGKSRRKSSSVRYVLVIAAALTATVVVTVLSSHSRAEQANQTNGISVEIPDGNSEPAVDFSQYRQTADLQGDSPADLQTAPPDSTDDQTGQTSSGQLDDPLLLLVNYENTLPEDYEVIPQMIGDDVVVDNKIYQPLTQLLQDAANAGLSLWVASGYRSVEDQDSILDRAIAENENGGLTESEAEQTALRTIAEPGCSEHHTGLAVDFNTVSEDFGHTEEYTWLQSHAADYGFVQRYCAAKEDITKIDEEVWHYRYVGVENANEMNRLGMCLEEYVAYRKGQS